jgi:transposase
MSLRSLFRHIGAYGWKRHSGWLMRFRRLSRDYEELAETSESMIYAAMVRIMLKRLATNYAVFI